MITFLNCLLNLFGYEIVYVATWVVYQMEYETVDSRTVDKVGAVEQFEKTYMTKYNSIDAQMGRPIHVGMSVAPPWAKMRVRRFTFID